MKNMPARSVWVLLISGWLLFAAGCGDGSDTKTSTSSEEASGAAADNPPPERQFGQRKGQDNPTVITTLEELQAMRDDLAGHYALGGDIDASATSSGRDWSRSGFKPIGDKSNPFSGSLDGRGHTITGLTIDRDYSRQVGLFGHTDSTAEITDVGLVDAKVSGEFDAGALVGYNQGSIWNSYSKNGEVSAALATGGLVGENRGTGDRVGYITGSYSTGAVIGGGNSGGLIGSAAGGSITHSHSAGKVDGTGHLGGLVGYQTDKGWIADSYSTADVTGTGDRVGGLVGSSSTTTITRSHSSGDVVGKEYVGGLVGYNNSRIELSYSLGNVSGTELVGGLVGRNVGRMEWTYSQGDVTGVESVGGMAGTNGGDGAQRSYRTGALNSQGKVGGLTSFNTAVFRQSYWDAERAGLPADKSQAANAKSTAEMQRQKTYEGWDFANIWTIDEGVDYPDLRANPRR